MKKKIRLTESELTNLIKQVVVESNNKKRRISEQPENFFNPEALETGEAIITMVTTIIGMLGIAGSHYIKAAIKKLRSAGNDKEAEKVQTALDSAMENVDLDPSGMGDVMKKRYEMDMKQIKDEEENNSNMRESRILRRRR
jgi:hypothetical protein